MIAKYMTIIGIALSIATRTFAVEYTGEVIVEAFGSKKRKVDSKANGTLFLKLWDRDDSIADLHYNFGDNGSRINVAQLKLLIPKTDIIIGRQLISWGSGYNYNPTDVFNAKPVGAMFDPAYAKTGRDALSVNIYPTQTIILEFIYANGYFLKEKTEDDEPLLHESGNDFGGKLKVNISSYDLAISYLKKSKQFFNTIEEREDTLFGLSIKGSLPYMDWGIWYEGVHYFNQKKWEYSTGLEVIEGDLTMILEYYYNGFGNRDPSKYDISLLYRRRPLGQRYFAPSLAYVFDEKITGTIFSFYNLNDSSSLSGLMSSYLYNDFTELILSGYYFNKGKEETGEYGLIDDRYGNYGVTGTLKINF